MFRQYDFECCLCGGVHADLVNVPSGAKPLGLYELRCPHCDCCANHQRLMSCPAPYMGEKVLNPSVRGGAYDTMGYKPLPQPPRLKSDNGRVTTEVLKERKESKEYKEVMKERACIQRENAAKKKRAQYIAEGKNINMRNDKLPGDPKVTS